MDPHQYNQLAVLFLIGAPLAAIFAPWAIPAVVILAALALFVSHPGIAIVLGIGGC